MKSTRNLWRWLGVIFVLSFATLGWIGREIYLAAPPIPRAVQTAAGVPLYTGAQIQAGQQAWFSAAGGVLLAIYALRLLRRPAATVMQPVGSAA
jgi:nitric oxide reductase subunit B